MSSGKFKIQYLLAYVVKNLIAETDSPRYLRTKLCQPCPKVIVISFSTSEVDVAVSDAEYSYLHTKGK